MLYWRTFQICLPSYELENSVIIQVLGLMMMMARIVTSTQIETEVSRMMFEAVYDGCVCV